VPPLTSLCVCVCVIGLFIPSCDEDGYYRKLQCDQARGECWCVDQHGGELASSRIHGNPDCGKTPISVQLLSNLKLMVKTLAHTPYRTSHTYLGWLQTITHKRYAKTHTHTLTPSVLIPIHCRMISIDPSHTLCTPTHAQTLVAEPRHTPSILIVIHTRYRSLHTLSTMHPLCISSGSGPQHH
jgi:hypothetical protein